MSVWQTRRKLNCANRPADILKHRRWCLFCSSTTLLYYYFVEWGVPKISSLFFFLESMMKTRSSSPGHEPNVSSSSKRPVKTQSHLFFRVSVTNLCRSRREELWSGCFSFEDFTFSRSSVRKSIWRVKTSANICCCSCVAQKIAWESEGETPTDWSTLSVRVKASFS